MRELHYGPGSITVGLEVCTAVFDYALALHRAGKSDIITVPILSEGRVDFSNLLLNPSTQIFCTPSIETDATLDDPATLGTLRARTVALGKPSSAVVDDVSTYPDFEFEY
ncbi:hypothetical protein [Agreia sp. COWG]|uniref:hypothetical protein n=1 Tax=Agreia sp. COWG TaxID=2773266 RepID=UPI00192820AE|nr:hypothetical protein [Agreia sp. COWG]CAD5992171.1 conserved protein of unknown function [Agreia sp. COWG]